MKIFKRYIFDQSFGGVTQKISLPRPSEVLSHFGWKFKTSASRNFKFCQKLVFIGTLTGKNLVSISLTILEKFKIEDFVFSIPHLVGKISSIFYLLGEEIKRQNLQFWISQEWFEVSVPIFHQLLTFIGTRFVQILMGLGCLGFGFPAKNV